MKLTKIFMAIAIAATASVSMAANTKSDCKALQSTIRMLDNTAVQNVAATKGGSSSTIGVRATK